MTLDDAILEAVRGGARRSGAIMDATRAVRRNMPCRDPYRMLDRHIQRLRRAGKIEFVKGHGWMVSETADMLHEFKAGASIDELRERCPDIEAVLRAALGR